MITHCHFKLFDSIFVNGLFDGFLVDTMAVDESREILQFVEFNVVSLC